MEEITAFVGFSLTLFHWSTCLFGASIILFLLLWLKTLLAFNDSTEKSAIILNFLNMWIASFLLQPYMLWGFSFLISFIWWALCFLYLYRYVFPFLRKIFFYDLVEELIYANSLGFVSLICSCKSNIWFLNGVLYLLYVPFLFFFIGVLLYFLFFPIYWKIDSFLI